MSFHGGGGGGFGGGGIAGAVTGLAQAATSGGINLATSGLGVLEARRANALQRRFVRQQLKRGHLWEVEGLRSAGLNPILSATRGTSATGAGNIDPAAPLRGVQAPDFVGAVGKGVSSALAVRSFKADVKRRESEAEGAYHNVFKTMADTNLAETARERQEAAINVERAQARYLDTQNHLLATNIPSAKAAEELYRKWPALRVMREIIGSSPSMPRIESREWRRGSRSGKSKRIGK